MTPQDLGDIELDLGGTILRGPQGEPGKAGEPGKDGENGANGLPGEPGTPGQRGADGKSTYRTWIELGNTGDEAAFMLAQKGLPGTNGTNGTNGLPGATGAPGLNGLPGDDGKDGDQGPQGVPGPRGESGTGLTNRQTWVSGTTYNPSDYVFAPNASSVTSMWITKVETPFVSTVTPRDDLTKWIEFQAPAGANGKSVEMQKSATYIQWRLVGDTTWINLVLLADLKGADGGQGSPGINGTNGNTVLTVTAAPTTGQGVNGDFAYNATTQTIYGPKAAGAWPAGTVLKGTNGSDGAPGSKWFSGTGVPPAGTGTTGDYYLNATTGDYYGPKSAGAWGAIVGNLKGPKGNDGAGGGGSAATACVVMPAQKTLNTAGITDLGMTGTVLPVTNMLYRVEGTLMTQGDPGATFEISFKNGTYGPTFFRMSARYADATGTMKQTSTTQGDVPMVGGVGGVQDGTCELVGMIQFSYVGPTGPELQAKLKTGAWAQLLPGGHLTFTPLNTVLTQ